MADDNPTVTIYTDGGCDPNPGPGGWAAVLIFVRKTGETRTRELSGNEANTTNNRMELTAAIEALRALKQPCTVEFYTDSQYVQKGITEWMAKWERTNFKKGKIQNVDLWQALREQTMRHTIQWHWVRGHAGNTYNERVDQLATGEILKLQAAAGGHIDHVVTRAYLGTSCKAASGAGGWAVLLCQDDSQSVLSGGQPKTSAPRLDLLAAIAALEAITQGEAVQVFTPSSYLHDGITKWIGGWKKNGWLKKDGGEVSYHDLWQHLDELAQTRHVRWAVVKSENHPPEMELLKEPLQQAVEEAARMTPPPAEPDVTP